MKARVSLLAAALLAVLGSASLAQSGDQAERDKVAFRLFGPIEAATTGSGNLRPRFTTLTVIRTDKGGIPTAAAQTVVRTDDRFTFVRTDIPNEKRVAGCTVCGDYTMHFDGFTDFFQSGGVDWKKSGDFPSQLRSQVVLTAGPKSTTLYVAEITDSYPGFEWLKGPFSVIRRRGDDKVYAVWSAALAWPVSTPDWEVEGAVVEGKALGQTEISAAGKTFAADQARLAERRAEFEKQLAVKQVLHSAPTDLLPQYKAQAINDPEAEIANSLANYIPGPAADGSTAVAALDVRITSPAWWTVSRGNRKVYILGVPWLFRQDIDWSKIRLDNRLRDARQGILVLPPELLQEDERLAEQAVGAAPEAGTIPDAYRDRVRKAATAIGEPADRYLTLSPLMAGYQLTTDFRAKSGLKPELVTAEVAGAAKQLAITPRVAGTVLWPNDEASMPAAGAGLACLDAALDEVQAGKQAFDQAMEAWANGDVRTALTAPRGLERCSFAFPVQSEIRQDGIKMQVDKIKTSLLPGGRPSVAVVYLRALLSTDGVLAQLQAAGYQIDAPKS